MIKWQQLGEVLQKVNIFYLTLLLALSFIMILVSTWKWEVLLHAKKINIPLNNLFLFYLIGYFFTNFLPTNVGGDVVRGYLVGKSVHKYSEVFSSVFMERFTGLIVLVTMIVLAPLVRPFIFKNAFLMGIIGLSFIGFIGFSFIVFNARLFKMFREKMSFNKAKTIREKLGRFYGAVYAYRKNRTVFLKAMIISIIFYLMTILNVILAALTFGLPMSVWDALAMTPIVMIISMLPISVSGIGLSEGAYVYCFSMIGLTFSQAFSIALLMRAKLVFVGLIGGVVFLLKKEGKVSEGISKVLIENKDV